MAGILRRLRMCSVLLCCLWPGRALWAAEPALLVIASAETPVAVADADTLRDVWLKKVFIDADGHSLVPLNLPPDNPLRAIFAREVLHKSGDALQEYWNQRYFHGVRPPFVLASQAAVVQFVARTPGAVGYILSCHRTPAVKPLLSLPVPATARKQLTGLCPTPQ